MGCLGFQWQLVVSLCITSEECGRGLNSEAQVRQHRERPRVLRGVGFNPKAASWA